jgi:hypothetical protein
MYDTIDSIESNQLKQQTMTHTLKTIYHWFVSLLTARIRRLSGRVGAST